MRASAREPTFDPVGALHNRLVVSRRTRVLVSWFVRLAPTASRILDVGCGDGLLAAILLSKRPDLHVRGLEVLPHHNSHIPVEHFDGTHIPFEDGSFDAVLLSDVLHHTNDPTALLRECSRVARRWLLLKDHYRKGIANALRLRFMDWAGNSRFGVALPYNYWTEEQWQAAWREIGVEPEQMVTRLGLYPVPVDWVFGARLHFMARLRKVA